MILDLDDAEFALLMWAAALGGAVATGARVPSEHRDWLRARQEKLARLLERARLDQSLQDEF